MRNNQVCFHSVNKFLLLSHHLVRLSSTEVVFLLMNKGREGQLG